MVIEQTEAGALKRRPGLLRSVWSGRGYGDTFGNGASKAEIYANLGERAPFQELTQSSKSLGKSKLCCILGLESNSLSLPCKIKASC